MLIKLIRHGESMSNARLISRKETGDHKIALTPKGEEQARAVGKQLGTDFLSQALIYRSPYLRARQTCDLIIEGADFGRHNCPVPKIYEDPRIRECDHGYENVDEQVELRTRHGWFYYRFTGGESPADCYDRCSHFLETLMRQIYRKNEQQCRSPYPTIASWQMTDAERDTRVAIIMHGLTMRCFATRFMHLTVEQFEDLANPKNCDVVTIGWKEKIANPQFVSGKWAIEGLKFRGGDLR